MGISFDFQFPDDMIRLFESMTNIDEWGPEVINGAMPILANNVRLEMEKHKATGSMANSLKSSEAVQTKNGGFYAFCGPSGKDENGVRNMEKLAYLEYGTVDQPATPVLTKAINDSEEPVRQKMQEIFEVMATGGDSRWT